MEKDSTSSSSSFQNLKQRKLVRLPDSSHAITLTSSITADADIYDYNEDATLGDNTNMDEGINDDYQDEEIESSTSEEQVRGDPRLNALIQKKEQKAIKSVQPKSSFSVGKTMMNLVKGKDFGEIFFTVFVPIVGGYYGLKKAYELSMDKMGDKAESILDDYANEMIYHDGDFEEMKMCFSDYGKKLAWLGPKKGNAMILRYLDLYSKRKVVSPQAISSLSYVFSLHKLSEEQAAQILVDLATPERIASAGKLLFFGEHILKSKAAKNKLKPIRELLASSYRDDVPGSVNGMEIVKRSQIAMAEAAYRAAVAEGGKKQTTLTVGWEVLGLKKDKAQEIFDEVAKEGFVSGREAKYASLKQKYDDKGRKVDTDGKLENPEEADQDDDDDDGDLNASGNVMQCEECGYTLFIAQGRDFKFYGDNFKCPECGANKDKFVGVKFEQK